MRYKSLLFASTLFVTTLAYAWLGGSGPGANAWNLVHIAKINNTDVSPIAEDVAPEATNISFPITIWIRAENDEEWTYDIEHLKLQYRVVGKTFADEEIWHTFGKVFNNPGQGKRIKKKQKAFGGGALNTNLENVVKGDTILVRLYFANMTLEKENASLAVDTGADGDNGWSDEHVVQITTTQNTRATWSDDESW